jgi:hypothetical protein
MGGRGSGGRRQGSGRPSKLSDAQAFAIWQRCEALLRDETDRALEKAYRQARPETAAQYDQMTVGEEGLSVAERAERRQRWLRMPIGQGHADRVTEALREDQGGLDEDVEPARRIIVRAELSRREVEARIKRIVQSEVKEQLGIDVHVRTIARIWKSFQLQF